MTRAGLVDVQVEVDTWEMAFDSARHLWDAVTSGNALEARLTAGLTPSR
ncbi:MAG TPA: hypothetical protein VHF25_13100 [Nitriliruptorales bacterium]|nr:hypothetical protein [Nitriliruptorales bacterium]